MVNYLRRKQCGKGSNGDGGEKFVRRGRSKAPTRVFGSHMGHGVDILLSCSNCGALLYKTTVIDISSGVIV